MANCSASQPTNATNGNFFQTNIPISFQFPVHHSHSRSHSHKFSLCFPFQWDSHGTHGYSCIMHTSRVNRDTWVPSEMFEGRLWVIQSTYCRPSWKHFLKNYTHFMRPLKAHRFRSQVYIFLTYFNLHNNLTLFKEPFDAKIQHFGKLWGHFKMGYRPPSFVPLCMGLIFIIVHVTVINRPVCKGGLRGL